MFKKNGVRNLFLHLHLAFMVSDMKMLPKATLEPLTVILNLKRNVGNFNVK